MQGALPVRLAWHRLIAFTFFAFALGMALNTLEPALLGQRVLELLPERKNAALGFTTAVGLLVAVVWQPIIGALSDRTRTRWGPRVPYFAVGTALVMVCLYTIALAPSYSIVIAAVLAFQLGSNAVQAPWQALIPDLVPMDQRGAAAGFKASFEILSFIAGRRLSGTLVAEGKTLTAVSAAAAVYLVALLVTSLAVRERRGRRGAAPRSDEAGFLWGAFAIDWKAHPAFLCWFINRWLFWSGFIALNTFLLFFLVDVVGMNPSSAQRYFANLSTILGLMVVLVSLPAGRIADRIGRRPLVILAGSLAAWGTLIVLVVPNPTTLYVAGGLIGLSMGLFLSASWAMVTDIVPEGVAARYLGVANIATAGGSFVSRFLGGLLIEPINAMAGSAAAGYRGLYALTLVGFLLGTAAILRLPAESGSRRRR